MLLRWPGTKCSNRRWAASIARSNLRRHLDRRHSAAVLYFPLATLSFQLAESAADLVINGKFQACPTPALRSFHEVCCNVSSAMAELGRMMGLPMASLRMTRQRYSLGAELELSMRPPHTIRRGFTLIELLVVIAVI